MIRGIKTIISIFKTYKKLSALGGKPTSLVMNPRHDRRFFAFIACVLLGIKLDLNPGVQTEYTYMLTKPGIR